MYEWSYGPMRPYELDDGAILSSSLIWQATVGGLAGLHAMMDEGALTESVGDLLWRFWSQRRGGEDRRHLSSPGAVLRMITSVVRYVGRPCVVDEATTSDGSEEGSDSDAAGGSEEDGDAIAGEAASVWHASPPREGAGELSSPGRDQGSQLDDRRVTGHAAWSWGEQSATEVLAARVDAGPRGSWRVSDEQPGSSHLRGDSTSESTMGVWEG